MKRIEQIARILKPNPSIDIFIPDEYIIKYDITSFNVQTIINSLLNEFIFKYNGLEYSITYTNDYNISNISVRSINTLFQKAPHNLLQHLNEFINLNKNIIHNSIIFEKLLVKYIKES